MYKAKDHQLQPDLAIKRMPKSRLGDPEEYFREATILYLSSHPNVVPIHYACEDETYVYLAMPYYQDGSLNVVLNKRSLAVREIVRLGTHFLSGLYNIHTKQLIHFDVKPDNILLSQRGEGLLSDFGLAKKTAYDGEAGQDRIYGRTAPPESFGKDRGFTSAFDMYHAGLTLYRMCVGNAEFYRQLEPFGTKVNLKREEFRHAVRNGKFPDRSSFQEHIPERLKRIVKRCLDPSPEKRPKAIEVINELAEIDGNLLDWQYTGGDGKQSWSKTLEDDRTVQLLVDENHQSIAKHIAKSGAERRITEYCGTIDPKRIREFLGEH